jgi:hypothetical protein
MSLVFPGMMLPEDPKKQKTGNGKRREAIGKKNR